MSQYILLLGLGLVVVGCAAGSYDQPQYSVRKDYPDFEVRLYEPYLVAETVVDGDFQNVGNQGFRILFDYISGANRGSEEIPMTAPVNQAQVSDQGQKIPMTAPVTQTMTGDSASTGAYTIQFMMPSEYTMDTLPAPTDPRVRLRRIPPKTMAVRRYSGSWAEQKYRNQEEILLEAVEEAGLAPVGDPIFARYNPPFTPTFFRRNEIMIEIKSQSDTHEASPAKTTGSNED